MSGNAMIEVSNLTKRYAGRTAVAGISFTVTRGEIVGLLGPNGAGKSTTMRILSCFMPATSGTAQVAGFDVFHQSDEVRRRIGYMPENNPLYPEMRVREYLKFRARLKGLGWRRSRERVTTVMEQCGLTDVSRRIIGQLSKGYKQRVGLADALVHEPELIILDEPTIGLDPHQIRAVRQLIKSLAQKHTVLISTHILPEVEMMCGRVLIMLDGKIVAADTLDNLQGLMAGDSQIIAEIAAPADQLREILAQMCGGQDLTQLAAMTHYGVLQLIGEVGTDLSAWPTDKHFTAWMGLAPGNNDSGKRKGRVKRNRNRAGRLFCMLAQSLVRSKDIALGGFYRRLAARRGGLIATKALARKLAAWYWRMMVKGGDYVEKGLIRYEEQVRKTKEYALKRLAKELGRQLLPVTP